MRCPVTQASSPTTCSRITTAAPARANRFDSAVRAFMKRTVPRMMTLVAWTSALRIGQLAVAEQDGSLEVIPYLWVAGIELETSLPNLPPSTPNVDRFNTRIHLPQTGEKENLPLITIPAQ